MGPYVGPAYGHYDHEVRYIGAGSITAEPAWAVKVKHNDTLSSSAQVHNGSVKEVHYGDSQYSSYRAPAHSRPTRQCRNRHEHDRYRLGRNDSLDRGRFKLGVDRTFYVWFSGRDRWASFKNHLSTGRYHRSVFDLYFHENLQKDMISRSKNQNKKG